MLNKFTQNGSKKTLRELVRDASKGTVDVGGTPDQIADQMIRIMENVGGDGFLLRQPYHLISRQHINAITEGLVPALQRRGVVRTEYTKPTLRETFLEF
jgi:alkanesulfonate monooxygenase SsuD/methylene tetrahydromethanopterin reductase-like flavin-dependent oxidoreductase (luciferase family)